MSINMGSLCKQSLSICPKSNKAFVHLWQGGDSVLCHMRSHLFLSVPANMRPLWGIFLPSHCLLFYAHLKKNTFEERTLYFPSHLFLPANMWPLSGIFLPLHSLSFSKSIGNMSAGFYMKSLSWRFFWFLQQSSFCLALARSQSLCYEADKSQILVRNAGLRVCMLHSVYSRRDIILMPIDDYIPKIKPISNVSRTQSSWSTRNMFTFSKAIHFCGCIFIFTTKYNHKVHTKEKLQLHLWIIQMFRQTWIDIGSHQLTLI